MMFINGMLNSNNAEQRAVLDFYSADQDGWTDTTEISNQFNDIEVIYGPNH